MVITHGELIILPVRTQRPVLLRTGLQRWILEKHQELGQWESPLFSDSNFIHFECDPGGWAWNMAFFPQLLLWWAVGMGAPPPTLNLPWGKHFRWVEGRAWHVLGVFSLPVTMWAWSQIGPVLSSWLLSTFSGAGTEFGSTTCPKSVMMSELIMGWEFLTWSPLDTSGGMWSTTGCN